MTNKQIKKALITLAECIDALEFVTPQKVFPDKKIRTRKKLIEEILNEKSFPTKSI